MMAVCVCSCLYVCSVEEAASVCLGCYFIFDSGIRGSGSVRVVRVIVCEARIVPEPSYAVKEYEWTLDYLRIWM